MLDSLHAILEYQQEEARERFKRLLELPEKHPDLHRRRQDLIAAYNRETLIRNAIRKYIQGLIEKDLNEK